MVIQAVADHEFVFDVEAYVVGLHGFGAGLLFAEEYANAEAEGMGFGVQALADGVEGAASIEDVVDDEDVAVADVREGDLAKGDGAGAFSGAMVTGDGEAIEAERELDPAQQVGGEDERTVEQGDDGKLLAGVIGGDLRGEAVEPAEDGLLVKEDALDGGS